VAEISRAFPDDVIVAEEDSEILLGKPELQNRVVDYTAGNSPVASAGDLIANLNRAQNSPPSPERYWLVDPIDGTRGFLRGDHYAVALALILEGKVSLAVLGCPTFADLGNEATGEKGRLFHAVTGKGSFARPYPEGGDRAIAVDDVVNRSEAVLCESVESAHVSHGFHHKIALKLGVTAPPFRIDSQCKYAAVASGSASVYLRRSSVKGYREKTWDHAPGNLIVSEAGGRVTDFQGQCLDFTGGSTLHDGKGIVATSGAIHDTVIEAIQEILAVEE